MDLQVSDQLKRAGGSAQAEHDKHVFLNICVLFLSLKPKTVKTLCPSPKVQSTQQALYQERLLNLLSQSRCSSRERGEISSTHTQIYPGLSFTFSCFVCLLIPHYHL